MLSVAASGTVVPIYPSDDPVAATSIDAYKTLVYIQNVIRRATHRVIVGHHIGTVADAANGNSNIQYDSVISNAIDPLFSATGKYPGMISALYLEYNGAHPGTPVDFTALNDVIAGYAASGSIIHIDWLAMNPWTGGWHFDVTGLSGKTLGDLIDGGKAVSSVWTGYKNKLAYDLIDLVSSGVKAIILRPFTECNVSSFWWGALRPSKSVFTNVWSDLIAHLSASGLNNILYDFNTTNYPKDMTSSIWCNKQDVYPVNSLVDIISTDDYWESPQFYDYSAVLSAGKPVAYTEVGTPASSAGVSHKYELLPASLAAFGMNSFVCCWSGPTNNYFSNIGGQAFFASDLAATQADVASVMNAISTKTTRNDIVAAILS